VTVIELGNGQVIIEAGLHQDGYRACVSLTPRSDQAAAALLVFKSVEAFDAMIQVLSVARAGLIARMR
jgi:hypothetical protein